MENWVHLQLVKVLKCSTTQKLPRYTNMSHMISKTLDKGIVKAVKFLPIVQEFKPGLGNIIRSCKRFHKIWSCFTRWRCNRWTANR